MSNSAELDLEDLLTFTTGKLLVDKARLFSLLSYFYAEDFPAELIPFLANLIREHVLTAFPQLSDVKAPWGPGEGHMAPAWIADLKNTVPEKWFISPLSEEDAKRMKDVTGDSPVWISKGAIRNENKAVL